MAPGCICPECGKGKVYPGTSRKLLEFHGNPPVSVERHEKEVLRCNACLKEYMSAQRVDKWTPDARASIVIHKIMGIPFERMMNMQAMYNMPIAESTMWKQVEDLWNEAGKFIYDALFKQAAECNSYYVDDTRAKILKIIAANKKLPQKERRACNTTVICTTTEKHNQIVLYMTGNKHCGENFAELLSKRQSKVDGIKVMADASSNNLSKLEPELLEKINIFKCNAHSRRKFHELLNFEENYCLWFLEEISSIYKNDRHCKTNKYNDQERLEYHQKHSSKHVESIYCKIDELFDGKLVEPNSALGKAMQYWKNHKDGLTKFLHVAGMALDNSIAEQVFKYMIWQRKNSYFFKTQKSANILSGFTSIIITCRLNNVNVNEYLKWIQENWLKVQADPNAYLPWCYTEYINKLKNIDLAKLAA